MRRAATIALLLLVVMWTLVPRAHAQRTGASHFAPSRFGRTFPGRSFLYPLGFFPDAYDADSYAATPGPPVIVVQAPPAAAAAPVPSTVRPVLIELQGDRYVRLSAEETSDAIAVDDSPAVRRVEKASSADGDAALAPVVLIFRDGHHEDVSEYVIAEGALYTHRDFYAEGSWNRKIELSLLNLPDTIQYNQAHGVRFQLPTAANEVIVRP